jgi:hypothetical protein
MRKKSKAVNNPMDEPLPKKCGAPGCECTGPLRFHASCHGDAPMWPVLTGDILVMQCVECGAMAAAFRVTGIPPESEVRSSFVAQ